ncbi:MAG: sulfatase-like hydrolase/transferase [Betaproteobacteria bacterium]|nr:sulfatase-like hydrolase/transferase [Betaproteobacteria bacterium]
MKARNLLFVMCDQLRADHLSCYGHPRLATPNLDALAARGSRFANAFVQSGVCGPSRMSFYTGRYVASHGATWNRVPLSLAEWTLGDYLREAGRELALVGKTHVMPDRRGLARFGLDDADGLGALLARGSFVEKLRHDGHHAEPEAAYADWLRAQGYASADPWTDYVIAVTDADGAAQSGWHMRHCRHPARVAERHSETAYTTDRAIEFVRAQGERPWAMHLSYVKPHWPYIAPAPYHAMYGDDDALPLARRDAELVDQHPVLAAYRRQEECANFMREEVARHVRPAYMGLVKQIDDHLGRLWRALDEQGRWDDTLVVFTSDHGDYLGDHWLGEKEHFHDTVQRVPLIVAAPGGARGRIVDDIVEAIDVVPTALESLGLDPAAHRVEGRSLVPWLAGATPPQWREAAFSELDWSYRGARLALGFAPDRCHAWMVRTREWKYVHWLDAPPQLFDLANDPGEYDDRGRDPALERVRAEMRERLLAWFAQRKRRTTVTLADVEAGTGAYKRAGVFFGQW